MFCALNPVFGKKLKNYVLFWLYDFVQILLVCVTILKEFMERLPMSALAAAAGKYLHILFDKYLDHVLENWAKSYGPDYTNFWALWLKMVNHFLPSVDALLEDVSGLKHLFDAKLINSKTIIFKCSENYGRPSPTRVTRLNVAPNMADPISLNEKDHSLNKWLCFPRPTTLWFSETVYKR